MINKTEKFNTKAAEIELPVRPCATAKDILGGYNPQRNSSNGKLSRRKPPLPCEYKWTREEMVSSSPLRLPVLPRDQADLFLQKFAPDDVVWIGDVRSSGRPEHFYNFRKIDDWSDIEILPGPYVSISTYQYGVISRRTSNVVDRRFFVVGPAEGQDVDTAAIIRYLSERNRMWLEAVVTDGKKFWGWFSYPGDYKAGELARLIYGQKCDSKTFSSCSFFPLPGSEIDGKRIGLVWFGEDESLEDDDAFEDLVVEEESK